MINTEQCKDILIKIQNAIGSPDLFDRDLYTWSWYLTSMKSTKFRKWKVRCIPGNCFIFNGKERVGHCLTFPKYENEYIGIVYRKGLERAVLYFFKTHEETEKILRNEGMVWLISSQYAGMQIFSDSPEALKEKFYLSLAADLENSLEICGEKDIDEFGRTLDLIHIKNI